MVTDIYNNELLQDLSKSVELITVKYEGTNSDKFTRTLDADGVAIWQVSNVLESDNRWLIVNMGNDKYKEIYLEENEEGEFKYVVKDTKGLYIPVAKKQILENKSRDVVDKRTYEYTNVLRSVDTIDFMTAIRSRLPYDIPSKPPATIEWE